MFESRLTSPNLKKWKTQRGAEKYLESISDSLKEYSDLKKTGVVERFQEIQGYWLTDVEMERVRQIQNTSPNTWEKNVLKLMSTLSL